MNINDLSTQLLYTTVPIFGIKSDGSQVSGTGFIFSIFDKDDTSKSIPLLITNYHVMEGIVNGFIEFSLAENNMPIKGKSIRINFDGDVLKNKLGKLDLIATPIWNDFKGEPIFLIDAGVFPGSSGSPVFIYNQGSYPTKDGISIGSRLLFVGIISETILRQGTTYLDLGRVINSSAMYNELENIMRPYI